MPDDMVPPDTAADTRFGHGLLRDCWYVAAAGRDLPVGKLARYELLGEPVLLGRDRAGAAFALRDICPHRAAPLSAGRLVPDAGGADRVECPYHGWLFRTDGVCARIPSLIDEQATDPTRIRVRRYPIVEQQGLVWVWLPERPGGEPDGPPPTFEGVVGGAPKLAIDMVFDSHIDHAVVGLMDPAHGPYVHQQWWWRSARSQHAKAKRFEPREAGFAMVRHAPSSNSRAYKVLGGKPETEITFRLPGLRWEHVRIGERQVLSLTCLTPLDEGRTRILQFVWSDHPLLWWLRPLLRVAGRRFLRQDGDMVTLQNEGLRYAPPMLWIDDADRQAKWYAALKRDWPASRREGRPLRNPVQPTVLRWRS